MFSSRNKKNYLRIILNTHSYLELCSYFARNPIRAPDKVETLRYYAGQRSRSVACLSEKSGVLDLIPSLSTFIMKSFLWSFFPSTDLRRAFCQLLVKVWELIAG